MSANLYKCLKMNWMRGMYEWVTFSAFDDSEARSRASSAGYIPESLAPTSAMRPM